ncbi:flagellar biosynthesis protein FlhB [Mangrovitalea sediminis]|uniref:flagellar biosynthesis protein FlhB n=1 Tax=Mangrovitalea sediminis TaxID=1982043 RepID=UPI000BE5F090|nr:flagellar biosynthesis protein FlhB [Mangrovitalea sediminis]
MAENEDGQEKSEDPTGRRIQKAREEGNIARSKELSTMAVLVGGAAALLIFGSILGKALLEVMHMALQLDRQTIFDPHQMGLKLLAAASDAGLATTPILVLLFVAAVAGTVAIGGAVFSSQALVPKFSRLNPLQGIKKMFSLNSIVELVKGFLKAGVVMAIALLILHHETGDLLSLANESVRPAMAHVLKILSWSFLWLSCSMILIALIDVPFQLFDYRKKLRMTKQEIKDEYKDTEGKPEVKSRIRRLQMEAAQRRMMQDVPKADVIITNPTHFAVALQYDQNTMVAPVVVAKGVDQTAMKIQEIAREHRIDILRTPSLTRAVYHNTDIGDAIPAGLYVAVAQVLAYLFQLRRFRRGQGPKPGMPDFPIPSDMRHD